MSDKTEAVEVVVNPVLCDKETTAQLLGRISEFKLDELLRAGRITAKRIDKRVVFDLEEIRRFANDLPAWEPKQAS